MPGDDLSTLQPPTLQSVMGQYPTAGQVGIGLAGLGHQTNPILAQEQERFKQQVEMMKLRQSVQRQRQEHLKLQLSMNADMLEAAKDPSTRNILAKQKRDLFIQSDIPVPEGMVQAWATKQYTPEQEKQIVTAFFGREQDPSAVTEMAQRFGLSLDQAQYYQSLSTNDRYLKAAGLPTRLSMQKEIVEAQKEKAVAWVSINPQFKDVGNLHGLSGYAEEFVRRVYPKKSLLDLTPENPDDAKILTLASDYARKRAQTAFIRDKQEESDILKQREIDVATAKSKLKSLEPKPLSQRERSLVLKPFDTADTALADLSAMEVAAARLHKQGYLATDNTYLSQKYAQFWTWWNKSGDPDVLLLKQLTAPVTIGLIDRGLHDERGTRAMQMFQEQVRIVSQFPTMEGYTKLIGFYRYLFGRVAAKQLRRIEAQIGKVPDDVVEEAQRTFLEMFPSGLPPDPTLPPGMTRGGR